MPRRTFIQTISGAIGSLAFANSGARLTAQAAPESKPPAWPPPKLHVYENYGWLRGLNCIPSWAATIEQAWWDYHPDRFREDIALVRQIHGNSVRLWIEYTAWMADPDKITADFLDAVKAIGDAGMKTMPCIFNRWHNTDGWDYGGTHLEGLRGKWQPMEAYVAALVKPLARDERILIWDLCNEPQGGRLGPVDGKKEHDWLATMAKAARAAGAQQPITIGTMTGDNITAFADLVDVLCGHPYGRDRVSLEKLIQSFQSLRQQYGKSFLVNECVPGCLDDHKRAALARIYTELLPAAGFGWMGWSIREGKAVATRRDRIDGNGINGQGFHAWFRKDGKLRGGLEFLLEPPKLRAPWEKG